MHNLNSITGTYGTDKTDCTIYVHGHWYCIEDSRNASYVDNAELLVDGVDVETLPDTDTMTIGRGCISAEHLECEAEDCWDYFFHGADSTTHDMESIVDAFNDEQIEQTADLTEYSWRYLILQNVINGHMHDACEQCIDHEVNPFLIDYDDNKLARFFISNSYCL